jgi:single-stranded DNA-binding protein
LSKDINVVVISGVVGNTPSVVTTRNNKRICLFNVENIEKYKLSTGQNAEHQNYITIEVLGRNVDKVIAEFSKGDRIQVNGYLRVDDVNGIEKVRIRAFHIEKE